MQEYFNKIDHFNVKNIRVCHIQSKKNYILFTIRNMDCDNQRNVLMWLVVGHFEYNFVIYSCVPYNAYFKILF